MTPDLLGFVRLLSGGGVDYIIVGGVAAGIHGALRTTRDLDVVYGRDPANVARLVAALGPLQPYLRGAPAGLPFRLDAETVRRGLNSPSRPPSATSICSARSREAAHTRR